MKKAIYCLLLLRLVCYSLDSQAQKIHFAINAIHLPKHIADNNIQLAVRDDGGLIWFVTEDGLYRYDGTELLHFGIGTTPNLPSLSITTLCTDHKGNLWLGFTGGAAKFDLKKWSITPLHSDIGQSLNSHDLKVTASGCLRDGNVYFGTQSGKLLKVVNDSLVLITDLGIGRMRFKPTGPPPNEPAIGNIQEPIKDQIWLTTGDGMLVSINKTHSAYEKPVFYKIPGIESNPITNICYDSLGKCLFSVINKGVFSTDIRKLNSNKNAFTHNQLTGDYSEFVHAVSLPDSIQDNNYSLLFYLPGGQPGILTTGKGLSRYIYMYDFPNSKWWRNAQPHMAKYPGELIHAISSVPNGNASYISSGGGLAAIKAARLPFAMKLNSEDNINSIRAIYARGDSIYIGSYQKYLLRYNQKTDEIKYLQTLYVYSILPWSKDSLLLGSEGNGLYWYQPSINKLTSIGIKFDLTQKASVYQSKFITVLGRVNQNLVLEGTTRGLHLVDPVHKKLYPVFSNPSTQNMQGAKINAIAPYPLYGNPTRTGFLIGTDVGAFVINTKSGKARYLFEDSTPREIQQSKVHGFIVDKNKIWVATSGIGLLMADLSGKINYMEWLNSKLTGHIVYSLAKTGTHMLIGTNKGLNILDLKDSSVASYQNSDGMHSDEFNQAASFSSSQQMYLGTINGIICWNQKTASLTKRMTPLAIHINKLTISDNSDHLSTSYNLTYLPSDSCQITIPSNTRYFSITFDNPEAQNKKTPYYYRLGPTENWINIGSRREITFNKMPPGKYKLQLTRNINGKIDRSAIFQIPVSVLPAYYQTLWFKIACLLIVLAIFRLVLKFRQNQQNKERNLRTKIAGDLHDEIGSSLTRIWHQTQHLQMESQPKSLSEKKSTKDKNLQHIANTSQEAIAMLSDLVWSIDAKFDTIEELTLRMKTYVYQLQNEFDLPIDMTITNISDEKKVSQIIRQNIFLAFKEGINNAIKYGDGAIINITITIDEKFKMKLTNTFNQVPKNTSVIGGRGIVNMKRRVNKMNGELIINSEGNKFTLTIIV